MNKLITMNKLILTTATLVLAVASAFGQEQTDTAEHFTPYYKYRVQLTDKKHNDYSTRRPAEFLSQKSIERRRRQGLKVDKTDLPVTRRYVEGITAMGVKVCSTSKWNNTVLVQTSDTLLMDSIASLPYVQSVCRVASYTAPRRAKFLDRYSLIQPIDTLESLDTVPSLLAAEKDSVRRAKMLASLEELQEDERARWSKDSLGVVADFFMGLLTPSMHSDDETNDDEATDADSVSLTRWGKGYVQIHQLGGDALHNRGFRGKGMTIAIIDGGFYNADIIPMLKDVRILGSRDFVETENGGNIYGSQSHGMMVLSCIAANTPYTFTGTAPDASFWLLRSEDGDTEQPVEEDNWAAAIEFADSVGADVVNTSLGYSDFDDKSDNYAYWQLDGHHEICSNSASMLAAKGMVLCCSAGNEADNRWKLISAPADAEDVLTVGALTDQGENTLFSSLGPAADGRVKPDVMAMGQDCTLLDTDGTLTTASGTSFASPIMCGMVACFWQANPHMTAKEVINAVRQLGDRYTHPDNVYGYGTPDFSKSIK